MINLNKYYKVIAKCGHVGKRKYVPIAFAVYAETASEASQKVKKISRVKKQLDTMIISCEQITKEQYNELLEINSKDPYLNCKVRKDQYRIENFSDRIVEIEQNYNYDWQHEEYKKQNKTFLHKKMLLNAHIEYF